MTSWNGNQYEFGPFGEVRRVVTSSEEWLHAYTAANERLFSWQVVGGERLRWTLRGLDQRVLREYVVDRSTGVGRIEADNVYRGPGGPLLRSQGPLQTIHFHVDHLGTPRQLTNHAAAEVSFHAYYPYGAEATDPEQNEIRYKFTGHERDLGEPTSTADDLDHMHARMTNPQLGRFLSVDPVQQLARAQRMPQLWNRYSYAIGNPLKYVDPTGESDEQAIPTADKGNCEGLFLFCSLREWFLGLMPKPPAADPDDPNVQALMEVYGEAKEHPTNLAGNVQQGLNEGTVEIGVQTGDSLVAAALVKGADPTKLRHIFGKSKHNLAPLVEAFGSQGATYRAVESATQAAVTSRRLTGVFEATVTVGGQKVVVRGNVVEGVARIGTFFIP